MARGRNAEPAQLKVIKGNFRPDRDSHGPQVALGVPACPRWLPKSAKKVWAELGPQLQQAGLIALVDRDLFAAHCDTVAKFEEVTRKLKSIDEMIDKTPNGYQVQSVLFTIRSKLIEQLTRTGREFGLSPAARSSLKATAQGQLPLGGDGWDAL